MRGAAAEIHRNIRAAQGERGIKHMVFAHKIVIDTNNAVTFFQLSTVGLETVEMNHVGQRAKDTILGVDKSGGGRCTPEPVRERVRLFPRKNREGVIRADLASCQTPERSVITVIIAAENEAVAFEGVRAGMGPTCSRAEVTKLDPDLETGRS
jgi:hypothetical protein